MSTPRPAAGTPAPPDHRQDRHPDHHQDHHRRRPGRGTTIAVATLATLLAATPWLPDRVTTPPAAETAGVVTPVTAGPGRVTAAMRTEIDRVVAEGREHARGLATAGPSTLVEQGVRCADLEGQRYCLGIGFTDRTEEELTAELAADAASADPAAETTGDLSTVDTLRQRARMSPTARAALERRELTEAAESVAKVILLRHHVEGTPLPAGFTERHPEAVLPPTANEAATGATASGTGG
ncbi:MAG TPA: hypothetical protein VF728_05685, partial [Nocardioides sp.]